jgi:hypothetical protein
MSNRVRTCVQRLYLALRQVSSLQCGQTFLSVARSLESDVLSARAFRSDVFLPLAGSTFRVIRAQLRFPDLPERHGQTVKGRDPPGGFSPDRPALISRYRQTAAVLHAVGPLHRQHDRARPRLARSARGPCGSDFKRDVSATSATSARNSSRPGRFAGPRQPLAARPRIIRMTHLNAAPATGTLSAKTGPMPAGGR